VHALREATAPLYGLPARWEGRREIGGAGYSSSKEPGLSRVDLRHTIGDGARAATIDVDSAWKGLAVDDMQEEIEYEFDLREGPEQPPGELEWMRMHIPVEGSSIEFAVIAGRDRQWGAVGKVDDIVIGIRVVNFAMADVVLEKVTDVEPYIAGWQEARRAWAERKR
jgi:hypothetical protein